LEKPKRREKFVAVLVQKASSNPNEERVISVKGKRRGTILLALSAGGKEPVSRTASIEGDETKKRRKKKGHMKKINLSRRRTTREK